MKLKKITAAVLGAFMTIPSLTAFVSNADDLAGPTDVIADGSFQYSKVDEGLIITKCIADLITEIPDVQNGVRIVGIGDEAFAGCDGIAEIIIPDTVKSIGNNAFLGCTGAKKIKLSKNLETLGENAFAGCSKVESVEISASIGEIPAGTFRKCDRLKEVVIPDNITKIGDYAFYQCTSLSEVKLPDSLVSIGDMAFGEMLSINSFDAEGCGAFVCEDNMLMDAHKSEVICGVSKLEGAIAIPSTVTLVRAGAFSACPGITELTIPGSVKKIEYGAFASQTLGAAGIGSSLAKINFSEGIEYIGEGAFSFSSVESLLLPSTLNEIAAGAFSANYKLNRIVIPEGVEIIGESAFMYCPELKNVSIPKSVKTIGANAFGFTASEGQLVKVEDFSMSVVSGTAGEKYAKSSSLDYTISDKNIKRIAFIVISVGLIAAAVVFGIVLMARAKKRASSGAKKASALAKEQEEEANYEKIVGDD
ncbi:MAG: leucine-rich repeat domain-containing protein [Ruminococcus sp.]|nr:leucine-rich repeat domain-containing protein [Ruminococcus sp.]